MTADQARAIIAQAQKDGTTDKDIPIPSDDAEATAKADDLVSMAREAWSANIRGPEVEILIRLADGDSPGEVADPPADPPAAEPEAEKPDEQVKEEVEATPPDPPEAEPQAEGEEEDLSKVEPWEDYHSEKVGDIQAGIDAAVEGYDKDDLRDLLAHIWAFEEAHRNRATILNHLAKVHQEHFPEDENAEAQGAQEEPQAASEGADTPAESEAGQRDEVPAEGGSGDGEEVRSPDREPDADAAPVADEPASQPSAEGQPDEGQPDAEAGSGSDAGSGGNASPRGHASLSPREDGAYHELVAMVEQDLAERLHVPDPPQDDPEQLPEDWNTLTDSQLKKFYGQYSNFAFYLNGLITRHESLASRSKLAADEMAGELFVAADKFDDRGKPKTMTAIETECESDPDVMNWRRLQKRHETLAAAKRRERDSYEALVSSLSRLETMRQNEWERSGNKIGRGK